MGIRGRVLPPKRDLTDQRFGRLVVLRMVRNDKTQRIRYDALCKCDCGNTTQVYTPNLLRGATTSCGCRRDWYHKISGENSAQFTGYREISGRTWGKWKANAARRNLSFLITKEYVWDMFELQRRKCALSGLPIVFAPGTSREHTTVSIDRLDISKGYEVGNIQLVHKTVNMMRNVLPIPEFVSLCRAVTANSDKDANDVKAS